MNKRVTSTDRIRAVALCCFCAIMCFFAEGRTIKAQTTVIDNSGTVLTQAAAVPNSCVDVRMTLRVGSTDALTGGAVTVLQNYLARKNYFGAIPNGYYGPATAAAVKRLQVANHITMTGEAGPLTRAVIQKASCGTNVMATSPASVVVTVPPAQQTAAAVSALPAGVSAPRSGEALTVGLTYPIRWNVQPGAISDLLLEDTSGLTVGYIASNVSGGQYTWHVGDYFTPAGNVGQQIVAPGAYRVHLRNSSWSTSAPDQYSAVFTVLSKPLSIDQMMPTTIQSDGKTSVVLYGSGYSAMTSVYLDGFDTWKISPSYVSADGTIIIFTPPANLIWNVHTVQLVDTYSTASLTTATGTPSNAVNLRVTASTGN